MVAFWLLGNGRTAQIMFRNGCGRTPSFSVPFLIEITECFIMFETLFFCLTFINGCFRKLIKTKYSNAKRLDVILFAFDVWTMI